MGLSAKGKQKGTGGMRGEGLGGFATGGRLWQSRRGGKEAASRQLRVGDSLAGKPDGRAGAAPCEQQLGGAELPSGPKRRHRSCSRAHLWAQLCLVLPFIHLGELPGPVQPCAVLPALGSLVSGSFWGLPGEVIPPGLDPRKPWHLLAGRPWLLEHFSFPALLQGLAQPALPQGVTAEGLPQPARCAGAWGTHSSLLPGTPSPGKPC